MGSHLANFGDYICVEEVACQSNFTGFRKRKLPRGGKGMSKRGPSGSNRSFSEGLAEACMRRHSSRDTKTAVSTPLLVTTWGPFFRVSSRSLLKRAFASCTCKGIKPPDLNDMTSQ